MWCTLRRRLEVEALENRLTPAGSVTAFVNNLGDLVVQGDNLGNHVSLMQVVVNDKPMMRLFGAEGTLVNQAAAVDLAGVSRHVRIRLGGGDDALDVAAVNVPVHLLVRGGPGMDTLTLDEASTTTGGSLRQWSVEKKGDAGVAQLAATLEQQGTDVMQAKLTQAIKLLDTPKQNGDVYQRAIDEAMEAIYTSNLVILPTHESESTQDSFEQHLTMARTAINALTRHINTPGLGTSVSKRDAYEARNFIQITSEAMEVIGQQTAVTDPNNPQSNQLLNQDDEGGSFVDNVLSGLFTREVRSPFFLLPGLNAAIDEQVILTQPLAPDEIAVVVKEYQGLKVVCTPRIIPIWVEPWFARATIVGFTKVWVWEFVPAEMIKTISFTNASDGAGGRQLNVDVQTQLILERQLLHFWRHLDKEVTPVG